MDTGIFNHRDDHSFDFTHNHSNGPFYLYHSHDHMEFLYVHEGKGRVIVNNQIAEIRPGTLVIIQPFQFHGIHIEGHHYERSAIHFNPHIFQRFIDAFPRLSTFYTHIWKGVLDHPFVFLPGDFTAHILRQLHHDMTISANVSDNTELMGVFLTTLCQHIQFAFSTDSHAVYHSKKRIDHHTEKAIQWIESHYMEKFSLTELARAVHLTPQHLSTLFRQTTGSSITTYIKVRRVREACYLLTNTSWSIDYISHKIGYKNPSHFCEVFKKEVGRSPLQYRKTPPWI